jgi:hypothetical protein
MTIEVSKEELITYTIKLDPAYKENLVMWMTWAFSVWSEIQKHPALQDEIFHDTAATIPHTSSLNYGKLLLIMQQLKRLDKKE